jgi:putative DNA primase/helicase
MLNGYTQEQAFDALLTIPPTIDHDTRARVGMGAKDAGINFDDYDTWQSTNPRYDQSEVRSMWNSYTDGPVKAGTLFAVAREHGWSATGSTPRSAQERITRPPKPTPKPAPGMGAAEVFARLQPASPIHPYVLRKKLADDVVRMLRLVPDNDPLLYHRGWLAVPGYSIDGLLQTIEFVPPEPGSKMTLKGSQKSGAMFSVGPDKGPIVVIEGLATASAVFSSTGGRAISTFGSGGTRKIVEALRQKEPLTHITIAPDRGKEDTAKKIAAEFDCAVACVPECEPSNTDLNDIFLRDGFDVVVALLESATMPPKHAPLLKPVSVFDVITNPALPPAFVWDGYLPRGVVALMGAHGGTGKSTIALMLAVCTALGRPLFGVATQQSKVLFVSLEDGAGVVRHRLASICRAWLIDPEQLRDRLFVVDGTEHPELFAAETRGAGEITASYFELRRLVQSENIGLVLVDNASDAFGGDEIQRRQVRAFMRSLAEVARLTDCAVMLLAHVDKNTSRNKKAEGGEGYSGSTAWHNSARSRLFLTRGDDGLLTLEHQKSNLGRMREPLTLEWLDGGFPQLVQGGGFDADGISSRQQGRADDDRSAALLRLIAEFECRSQYASPSQQARNNVHSMLKSEPAFLSLKLRPDDTKRIVNQCQRAKWIESLDYRGVDRKPHQRWTVTSEGRVFAGVCATTSKSAEPHDSAQGAEGAHSCAQPHAGGVGDRARTEDGAEVISND